MQQNNTRKELIDELAEVINRIDLPHPVRVGIDGAGNAGKTTLADELVEPLEKLGRTVIRATIDGFHNSPDVRRRQGRYSPQGYLEDSYNYNALKRYLLDPLGPNGDLKYRESVYNFKINKPTNVTIRTATQNSILIFEGIFLFNQHLFTYWDYKLYIYASFENTLQRALIRDNDLFGGEENVIKLYKKRYIPGQEMYLTKHNPVGASDIVLNNNDYLNPTVMKISDHPQHNSLFHIRNCLKNNA